MPAIIVAMKAKDKVALETLRAVKAELMTAETAAGATGEMSESEEVKLLMSKHCYMRLIQGNYLQLVLMSFPMSF